DQALQDEALKDAVEGIEEANDLAKKTTELVGSNIIKQALGGEVELGEAIIKLATTPGEIAENFKKFKQQGLIGKFVTGADLASKALDLRNALVRVSCEWLKRFAIHQAELAGTKAVALGWKNLAKWAGGKLELLDKVEKVANVITIAVSAVKVIDYIVEGKISEAVGEAGVTGLGIVAKEPVKAAFELGGGGVALVGGTVVVVWAVKEALDGAAAMKEWCEKGAIREAAWDFVDECTGALHAGAEEFVGNVKLLSDPSVKSERPHIEKELESYQKVWLRSIGELSDQYASDRTVRMGGQPALRGALGIEGALILQNPGSWVGSWESTVHQMQVMFAGASRMAQYVVEHYPKKEKKEKPKEGEE
ncbi:MAG TPA: hypothetical protein VN912_00720, partial [Candidatus Angelobacter sp.]|nr:hypothetical protein [Candidatus Angelobacter sp.]